MDETIQSVSELLVNGIYCGAIHKVGTEVQIDADSGASYITTLTLLGISSMTEIPEPEIGWIYFDSGSLDRQDGVYRLTGELQMMDDADEKAVPFSICFADAKAETTLFRADDQRFVETPWQHLMFIASAVLNKYAKSAAYLNDAEKAALPLLAEIGKMTYWAHIPDEFQATDFPLLKSYLQKFGYKELLPVLEHLEQNFSDSKKKSHLIQTLISKLNMQKYEPLWREIYAIFTDSQATYPSKASIFCKEEDIAETRRRIQSLMEAQGYSGTYPDFFKAGAVHSKPASYCQTNFIIMEKNFVYHIHCIEEYYNALTIEFLCGAEVLRKNKASGDIYSCAFNDQGRRLFQTVLCTVADREDASEDLAKCVQIAVKKAELRKLTNAERQKAVGTITPNRRSFFPVFFKVGGLLAALIMIVALLTTVFLCLILGDAKMIPSLLSGIPWLKLFLLSWILCGGVAGILAVLSSRH